jgi:hypothetical protein
MMIMDTIYNYPKASVSLIAGAVFAKLAPPGRHLEYGVGVGVATYLFASFLIIMEV